MPDNLAVWVVVLVFKPNNVIVKVNVVEVAIPRTALIAMKYEIELIENNSATTPKIVVIALMIIIGLRLVILTAKVGIINGGIIETS